MNLFARLLPLAFCVLASPACNAQADSAGPRMIEVALPEAPDPSQPRHGRVEQLRDALLNLARADLGGDRPLTFANQLGLHSENLVVGAFDPDGAVILAGPFIGPFPHGDVDPWARTEMRGDQLFAEVCSFSLHPESLPGDRRFAGYLDFAAIWPEPDCTEGESASQPLPEDAQPFDDGYEIWGESGEGATWRAALVTHPSWSGHRFSFDAALDRFAGERGIAWSMALPMAQWNGAMAALGDGTMLYVFNPSRENARACAFEGVSWDDFRTFGGGSDHPALEWCETAIESHEEAYRERLNSAPPPRIVTSSVD